MLDIFTWPHDGSVSLMSGSYHVGLVALSLLIAVAISCMAMQIVGIARSSGGYHRQLALVTGALALGAGIWSMHFIGMLAFRLCTPVRYDWTITLLSIIPAIIASRVALGLLMRDVVSVRQLLMAGVLVGVGIGAMHYSGMAAMKMAPLLRFDPGWFVASLVISVAAATFALWTRFSLQLQRNVSIGTITVLSGVVMGLAVGAMHYVAMQATRFIGEDLAGYEPRLDTQFVLSITIITLALSGLVLAGNLLMRFRSLYHQIRLNELHKKAVIDTAADAIVTTDQHGIITAVNPAVVRLFGWADKELLGQPITMLLPAEYWSGHAAYLCQHVSAGIVKVIGSGREARAVRQDGSLFPIRLAVSKVQFREQTLLVCFMTDITEQKRIESLLERDALHDALTDLPNRRALFVILPQAIARAERARSSFALLFIDLDGFKAINDSLGHECGDRLLKVVAGTLMQSARHSDFVVRLAGDEFVMLLEGVHDEGEARVFAEKLLLALGRPVQLDGHVLRVQASIGIAFFRPGRHIEAEALLREADEAMYAAKKQGKGGVFVVLDSGRSKVAQPG